MSPAEVVRLAAAAGLDVIAITDHDTAAGVEEACEAAVAHRLVVIPGIEISSRLDAHELHVLGYWIDPASGPILRHQESASLRRAVRMEAMVGRLQEMGLSITYRDVEDAAGPTVQTLGRPHLARALHQGGHTRFYGEAFTRFIGDAGPAFVSEGFPSTADAIATIHAAGGVAALAHPPLDWIQDLLPHLVEQGLDGVECFRPGMTPSDVALLEHLTHEYGLFPTGGSDWHGPRRWPLGEFAVPSARVSDVLAIRGIHP